MYRSITLTLPTMVLFLGVALPGGSAVAQQKQHVSYRTSAANSRYVQQLNVEAGDTPGHIVRVFDLTRNHRDDPPVINGIKLVEETTRGITDIIDGNGVATFYSVFIMENGDKFFARSAQVSTGESGTITAVATGPITGGTGKFEQMHGIVKFLVKFNATSGFNEGQADIDYSITK
jgi:hypothetical protein